MGEAVGTRRDLAADTVLVNTVMADSTLTNVNGTLYFAGDDGTTGPELWKSDGTTAGTVLVKDIYTGSSTFNYNGHYYGHFHQHYKILNSSRPDNLTNVNGTLFFVADDGMHGRELWKSDGSATGTVLVKD